MSTKEGRSRGNGNSGPHIDHQRHSIVSATWTPARGLRLRREAAWRLVPLPCGGCGGYRDPWIHRCVDIAEDREPAVCAGHHDGPHDYWGVCTSMNLGVPEREAAGRRCAA